jgi:protein TonB
MDLSSFLHLITKHTIMTNSDIMRADMLDILFENRNKNYGAYNLRKNYDKRLLTALGAGMAVLILFVCIAQFGNKQTTSVNADRKDEVVIREVKMPKAEIKQPEKQKEIAKPKTAPAPKVAQVKHTTPVIKPDDKVKETVKANTELDGKQIATTNSNGKKDEGIVKQPEQPKETGNGTGNTGPAEPVQPAFVIQEKDPEFPGGKEAFKKFMEKYLVTPSSLEAGETKVVKIKFKVDKDGSVNSFEIISSGGDEYDKEVVRVCKKMPRWVPAIQNGANVPVNYMIPVTFIGVEE